MDVQHELTVVDHQGFLATSAILWFSNTCQTQPCWPKCQRLGDRHSYSAFTLTDATGEQEQTCRADNTEQRVCTAVLQGFHFQIP